MKQQNKYIYVAPNKHKRKSKFYIGISLILIVLIIIGSAWVINEVEKDKKQQQEQTKIEEAKKIEEEKRIKEEQRQAKLPKLTEQGIANMENIYNSDIKRVFLTFDDGPSNNTAVILDYLKQVDVKVTFFELGSNVDASPELVKRAYDEGHYIASHGYSHVYSELYASAQNVLNEHNQCVAAIRNAINEQEYDPHLFRFPGGKPGGPYADMKLEAEQLLKQNGVYNVDWNALSGDAEGNNRPVEELIARIDETVGDKNSVVLLMHDSAAKTTTVDALPQIVAYFKDRGYEFWNFYKIFV